MGDWKELSIVEIRLVMCSYVWLWVRSSWATGCFRFGVPTTRCCFHKPLEQMLSEPALGKMIDGCFRNSPYVAVTGHIGLGIDENTQMPSM